jgi:hypothetical protein
MPLVHPPEPTSGRKRLALAQRGGALSSFSVVLEVKLAKQAVLHAEMAMSSLLDLIQLHHQVIAYFYVDSLTYNTSADRDGTG